MKKNIDKKDTLDLPEIFIPEYKKGLEHEKAVAEVTALLPKTEKGEIAKSQVDAFTFLQEVFTRDPALRFRLEESSGDVMREPFICKDFLEYITKGTGDDPRVYDWRDPCRAGERFDFNIEPAEVAAYIYQAYGISLSSPGKINILISAIRAAASRNRYNLLKDTLEQCGNEWDGESRIDTIFSEIFEAPETEATAAMARNFFIGAVERAMHPGCKHDETLVLTGAQGGGKSTFFRKISEIIPGRDLFTDQITFSHMKDAKRSGEITAGMWIIEVAEMVGMSRTDVATVKGWLSAQKDRYRKAYDREASEYPRGFIVAMTTNEDQFLYDTTGNRRYLILNCNAPKEKSLEKIHALLTPEYVRQLWGEAVSLYRKGIKSYIDPSSTVWKDIEDTQTNSLRVGEDLRNKIEAYVTTPIPVTILNMQAGYDRQDEIIRALQGRCTEARHEEAPKMTVGQYYGSTFEDRIFIPMLMQDLGLDARRDEQEVKRILKILGFEWNGNRRVNVRGQKIYSRGRPFSKPAEGSMEERKKIFENARRFIESGATGKANLSDLPFTEITPQVRRDFGEQI